MSDGAIIAVVLLSWPAFLLIYWIGLKVAPRKTMSVFYDMDKVDPNHDLD